MATLKSLTPIAPKQSSKSPGSRRRSEMLVEEDDDVVYGSDLNDDEDDNEKSKPSSAIFSLDTYLLKCCSVSMDIILLNE